MKGKKKRTTKRPEPAARPRLEAMKASAGLGTVGLEFVLSIALGYFGGRALDRWLGTSPYLSIVGFGFGVAAAFRAVWRAWRQMQRITEQEEREQGNPAPVWGVDEKPEDEKPEGERPSEPNGEASGPSAGDKP